MTAWLKSYWQRYQARASPTSCCPAGLLPPGQAEPGNDWAGRSHRRGLLPATGAGSNPGPPVREWAGAGDGKVSPGAAHQVRGAENSRQPSVMLVSPEEAPISGSLKVASA